MNELIQYRKKEKLKKIIFSMLCSKQNSSIPNKLMIEMLEELINLYKN